MTNPTSNFGWQMPTPTDLVTDLPADFEVFGQAVDTSMADLKGGTTGQILSKATNADMDFTWITNDVGDITNIAVTSPITGGGSSGSVTIGVSAASTSAAGVVQLSDSTSTTSSVLASTPTATKSAYDLANTASTTATAAIPKSTVTTAGDVIYATGSSAVTRLGVGSTGQVLTVAGGVPSWATPPSSGGMTLLSTTTLSGTSTSVSVSGTGYKNLVAYVYGFGTASSNYNAGITLNSVTANYVYKNTSVIPAGTILNTGGSYSSVEFNQTGNMSLFGSNTLTEFNITIWDCNSTRKKLVNVNGSYINMNGTNVRMTNDVVATDVTSAITNLTVISNTALTSGTIQIYGVK